DADRTRRVAEGRDLGQQRRLDSLTGDEQLDRLDSGRRRRVDEVLSLRREQPELVAPAAVVQLADELELLVLARGDQLDWASADLACSTMAPKAFGSLTARSASTLRSSSMFAFLSPATNWLYESPFARAPALMRMIHSRRNV